MRLFTFVAAAAAFATVVALVAGISSMATDRELGQFDSALRVEVSNNIARNVRLSFPLR